MTPKTDPDINILIVDDEPKNLTVLETVLDDPAYRLFRADSAEQALLTLISHEFALLILDVRMPGMTGLELAKMIKSRKKTASIPIIFLTAYYAEDQHMLDGYGLGAVDYLNKPVNPTILRSKVAVFAELHRKSYELEQVNRALVDEVAERRQAQQQLGQTLEELEVFSYSLAHDLRAPLRAMQGFAEIVIADHAAALDSKAIGLLERIVRAAERGDALIRGILSYSRGPGPDFALGAVDVNHVINEVIATYPELQPGAADVVVPNPLPPVWANAAALAQIVSNLLGNAVKFVGPGQCPRVCIRAEQTESVVRLWFEDNGIGIPKAAQARLFGLFAQLMPSDERQGYGVGLAIVRKAAQRMGGSAGVESEEGQGSRFWVELKRVPQGAIQVEPQLAR